MFKKSELSFNPDEELYNQLNLEEQINNKIISQYVERINNFIETQVREYAVPPIKVEITEGKLRWRGINLQKIMLPNMCEETFIMQRGKQIGKSLKTDFNVDLNR